MASVSISSNARAGVGQRSRRGIDLQTLGLGDGLLAAVRLEVADDDVDALLPQLLRLVEHPVGLAHAGGIAQVDFELASARVSLTRSPGCGKRRTSKLSARIDQPVDRAAPKAAGAVPLEWPTKSWVMRCSRAKLRIASTKSPCFRQCTSAPNSRASARFASRLLPVLRG